MIFNFLYILGDNLSDFLREFELFLEANLPKVDSFHPFYNDALKKMVLAGGKRFRPLLLLSVVNAYEPLLVKNAFWVALGVELLHTYSLIHDDLPAMDDADLRRGETTLHKAYDEVTAILAGDALNTHSFYLIANAPLSDEVKIKLIKELSYHGGVGGMVLGQAIDCYFENQTLTLEELKFLHIHKTAKLIASSLKMGAIIVSLDKNKQDELFEFGEKLGLLFQIQDDIIDATKDEKEAGKTTSNDGDKNSFVNLMGLENAIVERDSLADELRDRAEGFDEALSQVLVEIIEKYFK
ncbi:MAG: polyprenyl synthetase family protein [Epsilonproteobacteria bacterium]|jgi:farnesyl diphosphate synthase|nr:polyprenyl synthetase family protein [Campylobacterota bacterium]